MEFPNVYNMPFNVNTVRLRTQMYKFVLYLEGCIDVGCAVFFWTFLGAIYGIPGLWNADKYTLLALVIAMAVAYSAQFILCVVRYAGVSCRFMPTVMSFVQFFIYLGIGAVGTALTIQAMPENAALVYLCAFAAFGFLAALIQIMCIFFPPYTDKTCWQLCCRMYDNQITPELLEPTIAPKYPALVEPITAPMENQYAGQMPQQYAQRTLTHVAPPSPLKKIVYAANNQKPLKSQQMNAFRTVDETYDSINIDTK